jgi:adenine-specific DNA-methyltransferase
MDRLKMHSVDKVDENIKKIAKLFPNTLTEVIKGYRDDGTAIIEHAIDFDVLRQELSNVVVEGLEERYQFTWPDKKKSILLANAPIAKTLRPCREESVDFDTTENLYIEGDNLDALKLLQETYLGKVKMIYIDPPYNTGKDFIYEDDFTQSADKYLENSGQYDEDGNRLVQNTESNGRFHTDWLNMMYPRLKLAKDLLSDDGVIFISIDDNEVENLKKVCNEVFGRSNFICQFTRKGSGGRQDSKYFAVVHEYVLCFAKKAESFVSGKELKKDDHYPFYDENKKRYYKTQLLRKWGENSRRSDRPNLFYPITDPDGKDHYPMLPNGDEGCWRWGKKKMLEEIRNGKVEFKKKDTEWIAYEKIFEPTEDNLNTKLYTTIIDDISNSTGASMLKEMFNGKVFNYPKPVKLIKRIIQFSNSKNDDIILDFFSGSATTAHAVMQLNAEDGGNRKFIMVQLPEPCDENSEAYKAGYKTIAEIGKERIRRAGKKILEEHPEAAGKLDIGFRVLKVDSTNMQDVYYRPDEYTQDLLTSLTDNIKPDRTPEDLLFQVMLDLGVLLSSKIEEMVIGGKKVFSVADGYLMACFDKDVTDEVVREIAQKQPYYAVFRDSSLASDSVAANFEQIFETYSPSTVRKVL